MLLLVTLIDNNISFLNILVVYKPNWIRLERNYGSTQSIRVDKKKKKNPIIQYTRADPIQPKKSGLTGFFFNLYVKHIFISFYIVFQFAR